MPPNKGPIQYTCKNNGAILNKEILEKIWWMMLLCCFHFCYFEFSNQDMFFFQAWNLCFTLLVLNFGYENISQTSKVMDAIWNYICFSI